MVPPTDSNFVFFPYAGDQPPTISSSSGLERREEDTPIKAPHGPITSAAPPHGASTDTQSPQGAATELVPPHSMLGRRMASPSATSNRVPPRLQRQIVAHREHG
ncbi:hypothetical protein GN244_ATG12885 [Phytophthora infestans]|uniref:Uncharacterized protein n=1 Tax=Phytophthora infestans TaxID=4787 RepID=A0A833SPR4_PHYIN|nr:hypothetical protein GN244_ATG12885 [Phytophthora infestans]